MIPGSLDVSPKPGKVCVKAKEYHGRRSKRKKIGEQPLPVDAASAPRLKRDDAPTRAAVAAVQSGDPGWLHFSEPGGSREVIRGPRRRYAVGASGRRLGTPRAGAARAAHHADAAATGFGEQARHRPRG